MLVLMESRRPLDTDRGFTPTITVRITWVVEPIALVAGGFPHLGSVDAELPLRRLAVNSLFLPIAQRYAGQ